MCMYKLSECLRVRGYLATLCIYIDVPISNRPRGLTFTWWGGGGFCPWQKPTELDHSFLFCSCVSFCLYGPFNCISFHKFSRQLSAFSLCSSGLISALLVLSTIYLFMRVSVSHDTILRDWLGLKHQPTSLRTYLMEIRKNVLKRDLCIHFFGTLFRKKYLTSWERLVCSIKYEVWWGMFVWSVLKGSCFIYFVCVCEMCYNLFNE